MEDGMTIEAKVLLDSIAQNGARLTTFELTYPRFIHSELLTHRLFSRSSASSRAIPTPKKIERIRKDCAKPSEWGVNQKGMQAAGSVGALDEDLAKLCWKHACDDALVHAEALCGARCSRCELRVPCACSEPHLLNIHKQVANRILEPFDHIQVVLSTTKIKNHFLLRLAKDKDGRPLADPTYHELATKWKAAMDASAPFPVKAGEWHLPYVQKDVGGIRIVEDPDLWEVDWETRKMVSAARCARVSYMRQGQGDLEENKTLYERLISGGHWSPLEHVATPMPFFEIKNYDDVCEWCREHATKFVCIHWLNAEVCMKCAWGHVHSGNVHGWRQHRKEFENEGGGD